MLTVTRVCMSELLEIMPACLSAAADASRRLRAYVEDIDHFLSPTQTPEPPAVEYAQTYDGALVTQQSDVDEIMIPLEMLERIPWDWAEPFHVF